MNRTDFQQLSTVRLREAQALLKAGEFSGAYYLCGYAVECALKACFARNVQRYDFPDKTHAGQVFTHKLALLAKLAGIDAELEVKGRADREFAGSWLVVLAWNEESRYRTWSKAEAEEMIKAVSNNKKGVLSWLKQRW